eukprot:6127208-Pyramimonas_sp.AAC.4
MMSEHCMEPKRTKVCPFGVGRASAPTALRTCTRFTWSCFAVVERCYPMEVAPMLRGNIVLLDSRRVLYSCAFACAAWQVGILREERLLSVGRVLTAIGWVGKKSQRWRSAREV